MLCEKCKMNDATFYYHENVNGREKTFHLCSQCADEMEKNGEISTVDMDSVFEGFDSFFGDGLFGSPWNAMNNLLSGFFGRPERRLGAGEKKCPTCGKTFSEFASNGVAGCADCYAAFADELKPAISGGRGQTAYKGHAPARLKDRIERREQIKSLEEEQKEAIRAENYERAAEIRDQLKTLREETL